MADFLDNNWLQQLSLAEGFTVAEAVDVIENFVDDGNLDTSDVDIFIAPPENDILTDEDSGPEDEGGTINNLNGGQLSAPAEIRVRRLCNLVESSCTELQDKKHRTWIDGDMEAQKTLAFQAYNYSKFSSLSPVELFELFINNSVIELLVKNTNKYAFIQKLPRPKGYGGRNEMLFSNFVTVRIQ
ncbi:piggyBac transposable element-derived protein 2-like [Homalodisca vitripennis]|uniref:piggyBac transposable element-derived protein 2-like n=1 Tax=Homalodisca vitripennis TaxID=197043 RepID=UPI001EEB84C4|nr:piggyBac transposable element-derived protein 2-like [Homalodisca vitripennis]